MHVILMVLLLAEFNILPIGSTGEGMGEPQYNHVGLVQQVLNEKIVISDTEFKYETEVPGLQQPKRRSSQAPGEQGSSEGENTPLPANPPEIKTPGLEFLNKAGNPIGIEEFKEKVPAIVKFYSEDYSAERKGAFSISKIRIKKVLPKSIPDSLYKKTATSAYEKWKQSRPK